MENFFNVPEQDLSLTLRTFRKIIKDHGWTDVSIIRSKEKYIWATRPDGKKIHFCSCGSPATSYFSGVMADDKYSSFCLFQAAGIKQPETIVLSKNDYSTSLEKLLARYSSIVVKPSDGAHGTDVFVDVTNLEDAKKAAEIIFSHRPEAVLAQEQLFSDRPEIRVICIGGAFVAAYARIPATVTGDGKHTVAELIEIENRTIRTAPYQSNLGYIDKSASTEYMKKHNIADMVPSLGEKVQVVGTCNTGKGGTMEDVSDHFPKNLRQDSEKIAKEFDLPVVGIDYFGDYCVEVNSTPALYHPVDGPAATICVEKWVEHLESINVV